MANQLLHFVYHDSDSCEQLDLSAISERVIVLGNRFPSQQQNASLMQELESQAGRLSRVFALFVAAVVVGLAVAADFCASTNVSLIAVLEFDSPECAGPPGPFFQTKCRVEFFFNL